MCEVVRHSLEAARRQLMSQSKTVVITGCNAFCTHIFKTVGSYALVFANTCTKLHYEYVGQRTYILAVHRKRELATATAPLFHGDTGAIDLAWLFQIDKNSL